MRKWRGLLSRAWKHLRAGAPAWQLIGVVAGVLGMYWFVLGLPTWPQWSGVTLELIGTGYLFREIGDALDHFGRPGPFASIKAWLLGWRSVFDPGGLKVSAHVAFGPLSGSGTFSGTADKNVSSALSARITRLENTVQKLSKQSHELGKKIGELRRELELHRGQVQDGIAEQGRELQDVLVGEWKNAIVGLVYITLGLVLSGLSDQIVR